VADRAVRKGQKTVEVIPVQFGHCGKPVLVERDRVAKQLSGMDAALRAFAGVYGGGKSSRKRRKLSAKSRAKIAAAQRRRWAKVRAKRKA
jgi:hypothetical protein